MPLDHAATSRRTFLRAVGRACGAAAGAALLPPLAACAPRAGAASDTAATSDASTGMRLGIQLYTVRAAMARDADATLAALRGIGYRHVELAGTHGRTPAAMRTLLDRHGLAAPSGHVPIDDLRASPERVLDDAATLGHRWVIVPWLDQQERTVDGYRRVAEELTRWGRLARARGIAVGYHNHDFPFAPIGDTTGWDILLSETDPTLVTLELDVYWMTKAGRDPIDFVTRHPGRVALLHAKDATAAPERRMVDVGAGTLDFARLLREGARAGVQGVVVEHDEPTDALASARAGYAHLRPLLS
jgi:sugar phosphate isomerase/epimerase